MRYGTNKRGPIKWMRVKRMQWTVLIGGHIGHPVICVSRFGKDWGSHHRVRWYLTWRLPFTKKGGSYLTPLKREEIAADE